MQIPGIVHRSQLTQTLAERPELEPRLKRALDSGALRRVATWYVAEDAPPDVVAVLRQGMRPTCADGAALHGLFVPPLEGVHLFRPRVLVLPPETRGVRLDRIRRRSGSVQRIGGAQPIVLHGPQLRAWPGTDPVPDLPLVLEHAGRCLPTSSAAVLFESAVHLGRLTLAEAREIVARLPHDPRRSLSRIRADAESGTETAVRWWLESLGVRVYLHYPIAGYPHNIGLIVSDDGYGKNDYIETSRPLVVVTAPGPGSGKMAVCLSQLYHEYKRGVKAGYAKFETFPIWNLPLQHPVNLAYEAATADLGDVNMIDPFHLAAYGETTVNYNRDVEIFPVLSAMFEKIMGECPYKSPTDMGVNMAGNCIVDDEAVCAAARQEILRRYYTALCDRRRGQGSDEIVFKLELLMKQAEVTEDLRPVIAAANARAEETGEPAAAIQLPDGTIVTGKTGTLMGASSAALLNALKALAGIDKSVHLIARAAIEPIQSVKVHHLGSHNPRLHSDEILIALAISAATDPQAARALDALSQLRDCEAHSSVILSAADSGIYSRLGLRLTCSPQYQTNQLFHK